MHVTVYGAGYVGLVQAAVLADTGHTVTNLDIDQARIADLTAGRVPIYEPGLAELVNANLEAERLRFTSNVDAAVAHARLHFIAVGTPSDRDGSADLRFVNAVADEVADRLDDDAVIVVKSTVPVGTCDALEARMRARLVARGRRDILLRVASNPEFLKEGAALADCMRPDRIIIGTDDPAVESLLRELYAPFNRNHEKIMVMDRRSAEMAKYASNAMLATKISFINEMAAIADRVGADIEKVRQGMGADPRIGSHFIYAGIGYGGSCFPKDVRALIRRGEESDVDVGILRAVERRNEQQKSVLVAKIVDYFGDLRGRTFALWGLAFKPNTDDMREAPAAVLLESLWAAGARVRAHDPKAMPACRRLYGERDNLVLCDSPEDALHGADALIVATEWKAYQAPAFEMLAQSLAEPVIFDGRNIYDPQTAARYGLRVIGVGRSTRAALTPRRARVVDHAR